MRKRWKQKPVFLFSALHLPRSRRIRSVRHDAQGEEERSREAETTGGDRENRGNRENKENRENRENRGNRGNRGNRATLHIN